MSLSFLGMGCAAPAHSIAQNDLAAYINRVAFQRTDSQKRLVKTLFQATEIERRGIVLAQSDVLDGPQQFYGEAQHADDFGPGTGARMRRYSEEAGALAGEAARKALADAALSASEITHLITVSCTGFYAPGADVALIKELGLPPDVARLHVGFMGCHGAINALRAAHAIAEANHSARVLVCAVELCSLHFQYAWKRDHLIANSLFADGAAAVVAAWNKEESSPRGFWNVRATGSYLFPESEDAMSWRIGDHGFEMTLSARVPDLIAGNLAKWMARWLESQKLTRDAVASWAVHPGGPRILDSVAESLQLSEADLAPSRAILAEHGNMSSPTVLFILERMRAMNAAKPCVVLGFGPGLAVEAALLE
ncbi:MAG TPA: type III polyketide synthase [Planctomycetota bacterium]|nr:type III polyketide synthase [Planctomycetota bacterium]